MIRKNGRELVIPFPPKWSALRELPPDAYPARIGFIAFVPHSLLRGGEDALLACILWHLAVAANHLFTTCNPHQPLRFGGIPGDFYSIRMHDSPPPLLTCDPGSPASRACSLPWRHCIAN